MCSYVHKSNECLVGNHNEVNVVSYQIAFHEIIKSKEKRTWLIGYKEKELRPLDVVKNLLY